MAIRGSYAKGIAKREEILTSALEVIARNGYSQASVKELADAVGLSQAGLLHYFSSKEELFIEVLRKRDEIDGGRYDGEMLRTDALSVLGSVMRHNIEVPGLSQLYSRLAAEASDPRHPAHDFFLNRSAEMREKFAASTRIQQSNGTLSAGLDPELLATIMITLADGLQAHWILDPTIDMAAHVQYFERLISALPDTLPGSDAQSDS